MRLFGLAIIAILAASPVAAQFYTRIENLSESERARVMRSAINTSGNPCSDVTTILFKGADRDHAGYWGVACSDGGSWLVQVKDDGVGSSSVMSCEIARMVGVDCWEKF